MPEDTPAARLFASLCDAPERPGPSGVHALDDGLDAYAARALLAAGARERLDVQYYIWRGDRTGLLLLEALWQAADRGVRVRLLLDDNNTPGLDRLLARWAAHPGVELRLFNPFRWRRARLLDFLLHFDRANRRMHNKAWIADGRAAVLGGRNVGDEYFDATTGMAFADMDVLVSGAVVPEVQASFDAYWDCSAAVPARTLLADDAAAAAGGMDSLRAEFARLAGEPQTAAYLAKIEDSALMQELRRNALEVEWTEAHVVADPPSKILDPTADEPMPHHLRRALGEVTASLDLVSAYFVPTRAGADALAALQARGVQVRVLTNSLAATDVPAVHAGYARWRERLLEAGVRLYELCPQAAVTALPRHGWQRWRRSLRGPRAPRGPRRRVGSGPALGRRSGLAVGRGSSSASLHAKTFGADGRRIYVGSFNLDPRSARLNSELGVVIESRALAGALAEAFVDGIPRSSYALSLGPHGLRWQQHEPPMQFDDEPRTSLWRRLSVRLLALLPIDALL